MSSGFILSLGHLKKFVHSDGPILIVDDDLEQQAIVQRCYRKSGRVNKLVFLSDGKELLTFLEQVLRKKELMPELILLDINMPETDGFQALEKIKAHKEFKRIPIIIMFSTSSAERDVRRAEELGANGYWSKPSDIQDYIRFFSGI